jgi:two-component system, sensor histidine kinase RegB
MTMPFSSPDARPIPLEGPQIAIAWLTRIRWLAVVGQIGATAAASLVLRLDLPLLPIALVIAATFVTNLLLEFKIHADTVQSWLLPSVLLFDVLLLTLILALTGGTTNPFCTLYVVHVVLAVLLLGKFWTWVVVAMCAACFAVLFRFHVNLDEGTNQLPSWARDVGAWMSLVLIAVLIGHFIGPMHRALRRRDLELSAMRERNERSARFAAVTALAAGAAHEMGSPLGTIAVVAKELEIAAEKAGVGSDIIEDTRLIRDEVNRCRGILDRMRLEVGDDLRYEARMVSAQEFVEGAIADLTEDRKRRVLSEVEPGADSFFLRSKAILRAVSVLLRNGFEASPRADATVILRLRHVGKEFVVEVQDSGTGMAPDVLRRAGEPFFTTKEMGRGMGMGLFLVKLVIDNNDGRLELQSEPGRGTLARIFLPAGPTGLRTASMEADPVRPLADSSAVS